MISQQAIELNNLEAIRKSLAESDRAACGRVCRVGVRARCTASSGPDLQCGSA